LAFNVGEPIFGCTTVLYALAIAALHACGLAVPTAAAIWTALGDAAVVTLLVRLGRELFADDRWSLLAVAAWLTHPVLALNGVAGMETSTFVALLLAFALACHTRRFGLALWLLAALAATRPDGLAVAPVWLYAWQRAGRPRPALGATLAAALLAAGYLLFTIRAYGSPLPQSALAKAQACPTTIGGPLTLAASYFLSLGGPLSTWHWFLAPHVLLLPGLLLAAGRFGRQPAIARLLLLAAACHAGLFAASARPCVMFFQWYYAPFLSLVILPALHETPAVAAWLRRFAADRRARLAALWIVAAAGGLFVVLGLRQFATTHTGWVGRAIPALIAGNPERLARFAASAQADIAMLLALGFATLLWLFAGDGRRPRPALSLLAAVLLAASAIGALTLDWRQMVLRYERREGSYLSLGDWATANVPRTECLGAQEIGAVGWRARDFRFYDELGLFTPEALSQDRAAWLAKYRPAFAAGSSSLDVPLAAAPPQWPGYETIRAGHNVVAVRNDLLARWFAAPPELK
jgi:hypothetical protein